MVSEPSPRQATKLGGGPLLEVYQWARGTRPAGWPDVEDRFLSAMWSCDRGLTAGMAKLGRHRESKGNLFRKLISGILKNSSGKELRHRRAIPGLIFPSHEVSLSYPKKGEAEVLINTKVAEAPTSVRGVQPRSLKGRPGGAELEAWLTSVGMSTIDLKAECARHAGRGGGPTSDLLTWLHASKPRAFVFLAVRVAGSGDLDKTILFADAAHQIVDGVGLVAYEQNPDGSGYQTCKVPYYMDLHRVLSHALAELRALP